MAGLFRWAGTEHRFDGFPGEKVKAILILVFLVVVGISSLWVASSNTGLSVTPAVKTIGLSTPVTVHLTNTHGVRRVDAYLEQNGARYPVYAESQPSTWILWSRREPPRSATFEAGKSRAPNLKDGKARLVIEAVSTICGRGPRSTRQTWMWFLKRRVSSPTSSSTTSTGAAWSW
jgi:hypothetical protein